MYNNNVSNTRPAHHLLLLIAALIEATHSLLPLAPKILVGTPNPLLTSRLNSFAITRTNPGANVQGKGWAKIPCSTSDTPMSPY